MSSPDYRPALRGLVFGLAALVFRGIAAVVLYKALRFDGGPTDMAAIAFTGLNLLAMCSAIAGIAYSAIAAHRREWGVVLVLAWICSLVGAFVEVQPFFYASF